MKKNYKNMEGIDFELLHRTSESDYANLYNDFKLVTGWNSDIASRYNFLAEMLPTLAETEHLLDDYRQRYLAINDMKKLLPASTVMDETADTIYQRIVTLEKLKHAINQLNGSPMQDARKAISVRNSHVYNDKQPRETNDEQPKEIKNKYMIVSRLVKWLRTKN